LFIDIPTLMELNMTLFDYVSQQAKWITEITRLADFAYNEINKKEDRLIAYKKMKYLAKKYKVSLKYAVIK
jgi:hypothetical protein